MDDEGNGRLENAVRRMGMIYGHGHGHGHGLDMCIWSHNVGLDGVWRRRVLFVLGIYTLLRIVLLGWIIIFCILG